MESGNTNATPTPTAHAGLTPSQAMNGNNKQTPSAKTNNKKPAPTPSNDNANSEQSKATEGNNPNNPNNKRQNNRNRNNRNRKKGTKGGGAEEIAAAPQNINAQQQGGGTGRGGKGQGKKQKEGANQPQNNNDNNNSQQGNNKKKKSPQSVQGRKRQTRNKKNRKKFPWRKDIPEGTVDPITLEDLKSLPYPPFALVSSPPYVPVPIWPVSEGTKQQEEQPKEEDIEELNRRRLQEQWGKKAMRTSSSEDVNDAVNGEQQQQAQQQEDPQKRYYNLFDGRALAYYITSQLQFIDPLNRRDLTRDELLNLDDYLRRHGFNDLKVTEAYDAKGITLSSAGAAANTAQGRAEIMQQMARNLLDALFGGNSVEAAATPSTDPPTTALQDQYEAMRLQEENARHANQQVRGMNPNATPFGYGTQPSNTDDDGGFMIIDDDENPGLRGGVGNLNCATIPGDGSAMNNSPYYSASHITNRYGSSWGNASSNYSPDAFPALAPAPAAAATTSQKRTKPEPNKAKKPPAKPSKTLARITGSVKKTDPEERQRQWEAREIARKKAMLSRLPFGVDAAAPEAIDTLPKPPPQSVAQTGVVGDGMLQRNKAFADALGVVPATVRRQNINSGWARPTDGSRLGLDEFGNELTATEYPDELIAAAKDRIPLLLKLEKKWKAFLADDKAASLPLNAMDKPTRTFVHHYSDFWNLRTESFDPEPRRYIHCVKMLDTHTPRPLLSEAAKNWRGPSLQLPTAPKSSSTDHASFQAAGQTTKSREVPPGRERLQLAPRTLPVEEAEDSKMPAERPKLELAKRSLPLELPEYEPEKAYNLNEDMKISQAKREERLRKQREAEELKRKVLELAFASDSEEESLASDDGSVWEESAPVFVGEDEE